MVDDTNSQDLNNKDLDQEQNNDPTYKVGDDQNHSLSGTVGPNSGNAQNGEVGQNNDQVEAKGEKSADKVEDENDTGRDPNLPGSAPRTGYARGPDQDIRDDSLDVQKGWNQDPNVAPESEELREEQEDEAEDDADIQEKLEKNLEQRGKF